ncbi:MAG: hypothetical protein JW862_08180, partial [Anaerolineales bacterium]|nr:hypothetical protein [Anaerolineales bacterium]
MQMQTDIQYRRRKRAALWIAGFFGFLAATFLTIGLLNSIVLKAGVFDWSDVLLQVLGAFWLVAAVMSFELIRRDRIELAGGILFSTNFLLTLGIFLALANVAALVLIYYVTTSLLLISLVFSPESRVRWLILMSIGVVIVVAVEAINPAFRTKSVVLVAIAPYVILSAILVFTGIIVWQVRARS